MSDSARVIDLNADLGDGYTGDAIYQIGALEACARLEGTKVGNVKPHGAHSNVACTDSAQAATGTAIHGCDRTLPLVAPPGTEP